MLQDEIEKEILRKLAGGLKLYKVIMTYGDSIHEGRRHRINRLGNALKRALDDGGKVFIPEFSLGRTQELIYETDSLFSDPKEFREISALNNKRPVPVFIDSPLGLKITKIYSSLDSFWDKEAKEIKAKGDHPIDFKNLYSVERFRDHKRLLEMDGPAVVIAGSGMCTGGRIIDHLRAGITDRKNDIFFCGLSGAGNSRPGYPQVL